MMAHTCNASLRRLKKQDCEFEVTLGSIVRDHLKKIKKKRIVDLKIIVTFSFYQL
jgi:hypothetical protein